MTGQSRLRGAIFALPTLALATGPARAQRQPVTTTDVVTERRSDSTRMPTPVGLGPSDRAIYVAAGAAFLGAVAVDHPAGDAIREARSAFLNRLAPVGNAMGLAQYAVPAVAVAAVAGHLSGHPRIADATLHIALSYVFADASTSVLKFAIGRQRPAYSDDMDRFRPFSISGEWQSFPSGHVTHISSIAAAVAEEARTPWATALCATAVTLTGWQRIYANQHWASDVVAGAIVGAAASRLTAHWLRHKVPRPRPHPFRAVDTPG
jgi:membrane-associated phospholipid phosphatase